MFTRLACCLASSMLARICSICVSRASRDLSALSKAFCILFFLFVISLNDELRSLTVAKQMNGLVIAFWQTIALQVV